MLDKVVRKVVDMVAGPDDSFHKESSKEQIREIISTSHVLKGKRLRFVYFGSFVSVVWFQIL